MVGTLAMTSPAVAAQYDNLVPTANYYPQCHNGTESNGVFCQTDNATLTVWFKASITAGAESTVRLALNNSYNGTDLNVSYPAALATTGSAETDIVYERSTTGLTGSTIGTTWCDNAANLVDCDQHYVRFRYASIDRELACHETGHAVGLTHGAQAWPTTGNNDPVLGCMETPDTGSEPYLGSNNVDNINSTY
jgi:hypothetical protein